MKHWNNNLLCAIDVETTGLDPTCNEIIEIAVVPLDFNLRMCTDARFRFFHATLRPDNVDQINLDAIKVAKISDNSLDFEDVACDLKRIRFTLETGLDKYRAADLFVEWFENLKLLSKKRIMPLAHNWPFDRSFMIEWLGQPSFDYVFDPRYLDTMAIAKYFNDLAEAYGQPVPFPKLKLGVLCERYHVDRGTAHNALDDAVATAACYRGMIFTPPAAVPIANYRSGENVTQQVS